MPKLNRRKNLLVFLSHANEDKPIMRELCQRLKNAGLDPWLDEERILPGQDWQLEIEQALKKSDAILVSFSKKSLAKEGYIQHEYKKALDYQKEKPEGAIFVIPVRLDNCDIPFFLQALQYVDYPSGYERLLTSLNMRADKTTLTTNQKLTTNQSENTFLKSVGLKIKNVIAIFKAEKSGPKIENQTSSNPQILTAGKVTSAQPIPEIRLPDKRYLRLVGRETEIKECLDTLRNPNEKQFVALIGIGGVGKSALAREIIERIRSENSFSSFLWLTAKQQTLDTAEQLSSDSQVSYEALLNRLIAWLGLTSKLREEKNLSNRETTVKKALTHLSVLVVLDNLETALDQEQIAQKFAELFKATSCRAILTSREEWKQTKYAIKQIPLRGLQESDAISLMREVAHGTDNKRGLAAAETSLRKIARAVGYMPLAIKISVGLLDKFDLQILLDDLEKLRSEQIKNMYSYLFANTWRTLNENQKKTLIAISTFDEDEGVSAKHLQHTQVVQENEFSDVIEHLTQVSMIEVIGTVEVTRYTLHPLTFNFIRSQLSS